MNNLEAKIRDYLADNLSILDSGLQLIKKEFPLKNEFGAGGFIDILARDEHGHLVVIEIKRSDQAARSALHELTKYVALLKSTQGISADRIRALLVSTDWRELAVPFSEYQRVCEVPTEGRVIETAGDGIVRSSRTFSVIALETPLNISRCQDIILFANKMARDQSLPLVISAAAAAGLNDFSVFHVSYEGQKSQVIYPFGLYLIFSSPLVSPHEVPDAFKEMGWDDELDDPDENFLCFFRSKLGPLGEESGVGYPEKLQKIIQDGWKVAAVHRNGRYAENSLLLSDDQLLAEATKAEGGAAYYLDRTVSPKYAPSWGAFGRDVDVVLVGNRQWREIFQLLLREAEVAAISTVSASIYNPTNILLSLVAMFRKSEVGYLPRFQLVFTDEGQVKIYIGILGWNGKKVPADGARWIEGAFGSLEDFMFFQHFGCLHDYDDKARELLGITSQVFEICDPGTPRQTISELVVEEGELVKKAVENNQFMSIVQFPKGNPSFGRTLVERIDSVSVGFGE